MPDLLHDSTGRIDKVKLKDFIRDKSKQVIGWFRFRRNASLIPTMKDKILHKEFASYFLGNNNFKEEFFVTCLLSSSTTDTRGTHKFRHVFLRRRRGMFEPIPLKINNLGVDSFRHDGSDYKPSPAKKSSDLPDVFTNLIEPLNLDVNRLGGLESTIAIQKAAEQYLNHLIPEVSQSDLEVAELEKQVRELRNSISIRKLNRRLKVNGTSDITDQNSELEKDDPIVEERILEKISSPKNEPSDNISAETQMYKDHSTSTSQTVTIHKVKNAVQSNTQSINQDKSRKMCLNVDVQSNLNQDTFVNTIPEINMGVTESASNKNRRPTGIVSEIVKESIWKAETNESSVYAGRGKLMNEFKPELRKPRRTVTSISTRSSERNKFPQLSDQELSDVGCVRSSSSHQLSYSQATKKNLDSSQNVSESTENH